MQVMLVLELYVLVQNDENEIEHPVCYFSKKLSKCQRNYSTIEKETLALLLALEHFEVYVKTSGSVEVFTDPNPLTSIHKMRNSAELQS